MTVRNKKQRTIYKEAANISVNILQRLEENIMVGVTPLELDTMADVLCKEYGVIPAFKKVRGYDFNTCISVNDVAVHGIPKDIPLKKGDLVSIDFGIYYKSLYTDHCWTWSVGQPNAKNRKLLDIGREAVERCIPLALHGNRVGDLGFEMESFAKLNGFNILKMFIGHGIGKKLHDQPDIPAFGVKNTGPMLEDGMVICVECQVVDDTGQITIDDDGWSAKTKNGGMSVMFEYMVIVGKKSPTVLTNTLDWDTVVN